MNQVIPSPLAILFICVFAWGVGFFLLRFNEKVVAEIDETDKYYQNMINNQAFEARKNRRAPSPSTNMQK